MTASANVDLVRSIYADWERGDFSSAAWAHADIEFVVLGGPEPDKSIGGGGAAEYLRDFLAAWQNFRHSVDECRELDGERVLVLLRRAARGKTSGVKIASEGAHLLHLRDGKVTRLVAYADRPLALADLGLPPEGDSR